MPKADYWKKYAGPKIRQFSRKCFIAVAYPSNQCTILPIGEIASYGARRDHGSRAHDPDSAW